MAARYGILGQAAPPANTIVDLYTVPSARHATVRVIACNRAAQATTHTIIVSPGGAALVDAHYLTYMEAIGSTEVRSSTTVMLGAGDVVRVRGMNGSVSFTLTGIEDDNR